MKAHTKRVPRFRSEKEEAHFWGKRSLLDFWNDTNEVDEALEVDPELLNKVRARARKRLLSLRIEAWRIDKAKKIARKKGLPYQALLRRWIAAGMEAEKA